MLRLTVKTDERSGQTALVLAPVGKQKLSGNPMTGTAVQRYLECSGLQMRNHVYTTMRNCSLQQIQLQFLQHTKKKSNDGFVAV